MIAAARTEPRNARLHAGLLVAGVAGIASAYAASFQPSIYPTANFWTSSPTFFFIRLGICTALLPIARAHRSASTQLVRQVAAASRRPTCQAA